MSSVGQKWTSVSPGVAEQIRTYLLEKGGREYGHVTGTAEHWRIGFSDATFTYYTTGTLYCTNSTDPAVQDAWVLIGSLVGPRFRPTAKRTMIGLDETGKGEIFGHTVLAGALVPASIADEVERIVSVPHTKRTKDLTYWDAVVKDLDSFRGRGLRYVVETIPPWHVDRYNVNRIMDVVYQRILSILFRDLVPAECRVSVDEYGIGNSLDRYLRALSNQGADVSRIPGADNLFLEVRVASLVAKATRERAMGALRRSPEFTVKGIDIGSGNSGDPQTLRWLREWKTSGEPWPWFVKRSFKTVRDLDGVKIRPSKESPPIREDILSPDFVIAFHAGRFSISGLSVICPSCGEISKGVLITASNGAFSARCIGCRRPIEGAGPTLRYYCGYILPDSNIITAGILSKDLASSRFFEGFTIVLSEVVRGECDTPGGKKELGELSRFAAIGRIRLEHDPTSTEGTSLQRDEVIRKVAADHNAILFTNDRNLRAVALGNAMFVLSTQWEKGSQVSRFIGKNHVRGG